MGLVLLNEMPVTDQEEWYKIESNRQMYRGTKKSKCLKTMCDECKYFVEDPEGCRLMLKENKKDLCIAAYTEVLQGIRKCPLQENKIHGHQKANQRYGQ